MLDACARLLALSDLGVDVEEGGAARSGRRPTGRRSRRTSAGSARKEGDPNLARLPLAQVVKEVSATRDGIVTRLRARAVGNAALEIGGGRHEGRRDRPRRRRRLPREARPGGHARAGTRRDPRAGRGDRGDGRRGRRRRVRDRRRGTARALACSSTSSRDGGARPAPSCSARPRSTGWHRARHGRDAREHAGGRRREGAGYRGASLRGGGSRRAAPRPRRRLQQGDRERGRRRGAGTTDPGG